jgi:hypothetical protein
LTDPWELIATSAPRAWEVFDALDRWIGRVEAGDAEGAAHEVREWLSDEAAWQRLEPHEARVRLWCLATDERVRCALEVDGTGRDRRMA